MYQYYRFSAVTQKTLNNINDNNSVVELSVYFKTDKSFPCIGFFNNKSNFASGFFFVMVRMDQFQPVCPSPPRGVQWLRYVTSSSTQVLVNTPPGEMMNRWQQMWNWR